MARKPKQALFYLMPIGTALQQILPRRFVLGLGRLYIRLAFSRMKGSRRVLAQNLKYLLGREPTQPEADDYARRVLCNLTSARLDLLRAPWFCKGDRFARLMSHGDYRPQLDAVLKGGQAAILVTAHVGNWDLAGIFLAHEGYPIHAVFERIPRGLSDAFNRLRGTSGMGLIGLDEREKMDEALRTGKLFVLVGDRDMRGNGLELSWFNGRRTFPRGAAAFALRYKVPVVIGHMVFDPEDPHHRYRAVVEPPLDFTPGGDHAQDVETLTALIVRRLDQIVRQYPDQWQVLQPRWIEPESAAPGDHG